MSDITQVGIVGAGTMGSGIAELFAESGYDVIWYNRSETGIQRGLTRIRANQATLIRNSMLTQDEAEAALARLHPTYDLTELSSVDLISESVAEDLEVKQDLFRSLDRLCHDETILTTNTSGLLISNIATAVSHPERLAGMHFATPPQVMPIMEIIKGERTSDATWELLLELAQVLHKHAVFVRKDVPGFIGNRLQVALIREAFHLIEEGVATPADIDTMMKHGLGLRWAFLGPLEGMDLGGLDVVNAVYGYLFQELSDAKQPPRILQELVAAGKLGAKSGSGFYEYAAGRAERIIDDRDAKLLKLLQLKSQFEA